MTMKPFFLAIALIVFAMPCHAADITTNADGATTFPRHSSYLRFDIIGRIEPGDERKFLALPLVPHGTVYLASPGGSLDAAIAIGEHIHLNRYATTAMGSCASACALIWLAGSRKTILGGGNVGFHQASLRSTGQASEPANAKLGAYLARLGYGPEVIRFFTLAPPNLMIWLTPAIVKELGLDVIGADRSPIIEKTISKHKCRDYAEKITGTCAD
jgi:Clp protease